jgi:CubicO group peptidase (beta-lactamase class C family)
VRACPLRPASRLFLAFVLALGPAVVARPAGAADERLEQAIDAFARPLVEAGHLSGQLLVSRDGRVLAERSWGLAQRELGVPITPETRINIASITKPMTMILALQLVEERKLALADTLGRWIPGFPAGDSITVEHLYRHRSGIPHRVTTEQDETVPMRPADLVAFARKAPLQFAPGTASSYSSAGYTVLTRVLELAAGRTYEQLLEERLFRPLGMTRTLHADARTLVEGRAASYVPGLHGIANAPLKDMSFLAGAGSLLSTARDLHVLLRAVLDGRLGAGARGSLVRGGRVAWNGSSNGFRAFADWDSASGLAIVFAGNVHTGAPDLVRQAIPRLVAGETVPPPALPDLAAAIAGAGPERTTALRAYEGVYQLGNGVRLEVRARDGVLAANEWILVPTPEGAFFSLRDYGTVTPVRAADGRVERFDWKVGADTWPAPRVADLP